jgi:hypothetical protein
MREKKLPCSKTQKDTDTRSNSFSIQKIIVLNTQKETSSNNLLTPLPKINKGVGGPSGMYFSRWVRLGREWSILDLR